MFCIFSFQFFLFTYEQQEKRNSIFCLIFTYKKNYVPLLKCISKHDLGSIKAGFHFKNFMRLLIAILDFFM